LTLRDDLQEIAERVERYRGSRLNEQNTKRALIDPVLRLLGWDTEDVEEVQQEYRRQRSDNPVDYALMLVREPRLFVEAKALDEDLEDRRWASQVIGYATVAGVEWVVLTNGDEYRIYNAHAPVPVDEKLFETARISADLKKAEEALQLLAKDQLQANSIATLWRAHSVDRRVKQTVEALFSPEPAAWLVRRLVRELDGLSAMDIRAALHRARIKLDFPPEEVAEPEVRPKAEEQEPPARRPKVYGVSIADLIRAGLIRPPLELTNSYLGRELRAQIESDGLISFGGERFNSLSTAAGMARASIRGAPPGRRFPQTNGWTFWKFIDADGKNREIDELRQRFLQGKGPQAA